MKRTASITALAILVAAVCLAQTPTGTIAGIVYDASGAVIADASLQAIDRTSGLSRTTTTTAQGDYSFSTLPAGEYDLLVQTAGFRRMMRLVTVEVGTTTSADFVMQAGDVIESVTVTSALPQIRRDSAAVSGVIGRSQIEGVPLNGRSFLELSKLEPGVLPPNGANRNRTLVPMLDAPAGNISGARFTVDGGNITAVGLAGAQMGLSQEAVQEFQVSTVNFDVANGFTGVGAVNVVTRAGGNTLQGTAFEFFRDHHMAAYPALNRDPTNPDPFFERQQFGFALGGPIRHDRAFYFGTWERNVQQGVAATALVTPDFARFNRVTESPLTGNLVSVRIDGRIGGAHTAFLRVSHDGSRAYGPAASVVGGSPSAYPSSWNRALVRADQGLAGVTSVLSPTLVNDLRLSYFVVSSNIAPPDEGDCPGCLGHGAPSITVSQTGLVIGNSAHVDNLERRFQLNESIVWQRNTHRVRAGVDWAHSRDRNFIRINEPVTMTLFSPDRVRASNALPQAPPDLRIPLPAAFNTLDDLLQLPLQSMTIGVGDLGVPQEDGSPVRSWNTVWLYAQDAWRLHERLTLNYGLGWGFDGVLNHDLSKPALLEPLLGTGGLGPTRNDWTNFAPVLGLAWTPAADGKTVVRGGASRFHGLQGLTSSMDAERVALGPPGLGRQTFSGTSILNTRSGIPNVPVGTPLDFRTPTLFTGADLLAILPAIRADLANRRASAGSGVQAIQLTKQATAPAIFPADVPSPSVLHVSAGLQREIAPGFVVSADLVYRHFEHVPQNGGALDLNRFGSGHPVIPVCAPAQRDDPQALCSLGQILVQVAPFVSTYRGLLLRADKRFSGGWQLLGSYAYSTGTGTSPGNGFNLDDWGQNSGPSGLPHELNLAGLAQLPWRLDLGFNFSYASAPGFSAYVGDIDFNGDGTVGDLLPGTTLNAFNRSLNRADLERLVAAFNQTYAGRPDGLGTTIPRLTLPGRYSFGDSFHAVDARLSRLFALGGRWRVSLIGEVFNLYNSPNLSGFSGDLTSALFGQPTSRATQVFGSSGPRAFQLAVRLEF